MGFITDFFKALVAAYVTPRASAASILSSGAGMAEAFLMVVLGYLLTEISIIAFLGAYPLQPSVLTRHIGGLIGAFLWFFIISALISFLGRASGGTGTREQSQVIVAWHSVVTSFLWVPVNAMFMQFQTEEVDGVQKVIAYPDQSAIAMALGAFVVILLMLANFITVLHRFPNFLGVAAVVLGIPTGIAFFFLNIVMMNDMVQQELSR